MCEDSDRKQLGILASITAAVEVTQTEISSVRIRTDAETYEAQVRLAIPLHGVDGLDRARIETDHTEITENSLQFDLTVEVDSAGRSSLTTPQSSSQDQTTGESHPPDEAERADQPNGHARPAGQRDDVGNGEGNESDGEDEAGDEGDGENGKDNESDGKGEAGDEGDGGNEGGDEGDGENGGNGREAETENGGESDDESEGSDNGEAGNEDSDDKKAGTLSVEDARSDHKGDGQNGRNVNPGDKQEPPEYQDPERLAAVYEDNETFEEMRQELDVDVTAQTIRKYMIEHGIHEPEPRPDRLLEAIRASELELMKSEDDSRPGRAGRSANSDADAS